MGESSLQAYFIKKVKEEGGLAFKVDCTSQRGFPDLIVSTDWGLKLVEMKAENGRLSIHQKRLHNVLAEHGLEVTVLDSHESVDKWIRDYFYNPY